MLIIPVPPGGGRPALVVPDGNVRFHFWSLPKPFCESETRLTVSLSKKKEAERTKKLHTTDGSDGLLCF